MYQYVLVELDFSDPVKLKTATLIVCLYFTYHYVTL